MPVGDENVWKKRFPKVKAPVIPVLVWPDGTYRNDSTPLIMQLEKDFPFARPCIPQDPVLGFVNMLLEDFADEWLTKVMFEGRFHTSKDAAFGGMWQVAQDPNRAEYTEQLGNAFAARQVNRREMVGCTNWETIERTYRTVCEAIQTNVRAGNAFLLGAQPSSCDFAFYGQLRQLATDPFPAKIMHEYPEVFAWVFRVEDLSGYEAPAGTLPSLTTGTKTLLELASKTHVPFLVANYHALSRNLEDVSVEIFDGAIVHTQPTFKYQGTCWKALMLLFNALDENSKEDLLLVLPTAISKALSGSSSSRL
eukprot:CAMPEP_0203772324 /NCGR_PEP_ID=MMETSP0099_2-20121227/3964_1 /ASSEMBLY_ACC=CAM_ASM_000209 /TAXON_ID=96639 /ORGANISM=" , Strain NY0313808BC1" /LENGTH=307 /DNA_ID=CAMNT_0050669881 /DNA_START=86 /DNA_END=1009 /DNA_ORIENTATION=+